MPCVDGFEVPVKEWCSLNEAVLWLEVGQEPVDIEYEGAIFGRDYPPFALAKSGLEAQAKNGVSLARLFLLGGSGRVRFRGRPLIGGPEVEAIDWGPELGQTSGLRFSVLGDLVDISPERILKVGSVLFCLQVRDGIIGDGNIYPNASSIPASGYGYGDLSLNFYELTRACSTVVPVAEVISNNPNIINRKGIGGARVQYNWTNAIINLFTELQYRQNKDDDRGWWKESICNSVSTEEKIPSDKSIRLKLKIINMAIDGCGYKCRPGRAAKNDVDAVTIYTLVDILYERCEISRRGILQNMKKILRDWELDFDENDISQISAKILTSHTRNSPSGRR